MTSEVAPDSARAVVAVVYDDATEPDVRSQVPPLLRALREAGARTDAAVFTSRRALFVPSSRTEHRAALGALADSTGVHPMRRTCRAGDKGLSILGWTLARDLVRRGLEGSTLLCRDPRAALVGIACRDALLAKSRAAPRVVLHLHGVRDAEYLMTLGKPDEELTDAERKRLDGRRSQEARACEGADAVLCVSEPMRRHVVARHGVEPSRVGRVPNHAEPVATAETLRERAREELGVARGATLLAYVDGPAAWQLPLVSIRLAAALRDVHRGTRLLFLAPDAGGAKKALALAGASDVLVRELPDGSAEGVICAADYGLLLREDAIVNRVACPLEFGRYLACGVRPVLAPNVGDQSDLCLRSDLGVVVGLANLAEAARRLAADVVRPGALDLAGRERRRAWTKETIAPQHAAARILAFLAETPFPPRGAAPRASV